MQLGRLLAFFVLPACAVGIVEDEYWDETVDDDGTDSELIAAGTTKRATVRWGAVSDAERISLLPVGKSEGSAERKVALRMSPSDLPQLADGDRLLVPAELEVTTRCDIGQTGPGCGYNPNVRAQLILTGNPDDTTGGGASRVIATRTQTCTKDEHHCMFVFTPGTAAIRLDASTPCVASNSCYVNLVIWAWHGDARSGGQDKLLVGSNEGNFLDNGIVDTGKARLMAVRERGLGMADRSMRETSGSGTKSINTNANAELVYSHRLKAKGQPLRANEQFVIEALVVANVSSRARFSSQMFVTRNPDATDAGRFELVSPESISEHNGRNCTGGECATRKVAVFRVNQDINDDLFVNIFVKSEVPGPGSARVTVNKAKGFVRSVRYGAALSGR